MIAYIKGTVEEIAGQSVVIDNAGIGYWVNVPSAVLSRLPPKGEEVKLSTYLQVKEDDMSLFGFISQEDLKIFRLLISISGIGPKVALAVLSVMTTEQIMAAISSGDAVAFSKVPGVGKKTAQRITLELSDKITTTEAGSASAFSSEKQDAMDALLALGYSRSESVRAVMSVAEEDMPAQQVIRLALKKLT